MKKQLVNRETNEDVLEFINKVDIKVRKSDALEVLEMMKEITGHEPRKWGASIVGFGKYSYQRKNGDEFEWFNVGFSPAKAHLSIYLTYDVSKEKLLQELGPHKCGKGCLYIKRLDQIDKEVLKKMIAKSHQWER